MLANHSTGATAGSLHRDASLGWALVRLVLLKILLLSCLWGMFFQGRAVGVDAPAAARHLAGEAVSAAAPASATVQGAHHAR